MKSVLKVYDVELRAEGPVYIGSGKEIGKKEYAYSLGEKRISVMDISKLCRLLKQKNLVHNYEKFMLSFSKDDVGAWLEKQGVSKQEYMKCVRYELDCGDAVLDSHSKLSVMEFIKDAYEMPYVPGSSLKGMLRTILLSNDIMKNEQKYASIKSQIGNGNERIGNRNNYLKREATAVEDKYFRILARPETKETDAVNDILAGLIISDSAPLSTENLILCQRAELHVDGTEKKLNVLREALRPGTIVRFQMTIDSSICKITKEEIEEAIFNFGKTYYQCFLKKYSSMIRPEQNAVWLGGGAGFLTKTEVYPLFGEMEGIDATVNIFRATRVPENHKHFRDRRLGVSPHICKVTYWNRKRYQMGLCSIKITKKV